MYWKASGLLLVGLVLWGCADRGGIEARTGTRPAASGSVQPEERIAQPARMRELAESAAAASAERDRARARLRLELERRLRARGQYHGRVAQGIGSTAALAAMDATIARLQERIEALERPPATDVHGAAVGCIPTSSGQEVGGNAESESARLGWPAERSCVGVAAVCLPAKRCP